MKNGEDIVECVPMLIEIPVWAQIFVDEQHFSILIAIDAGMALRKFEISSE